MSIAKISRFPPMPALAFCLGAALFVALIGHGMPWASLAAKLVPVGALMIWIAPPRERYRALVLAGLGLSLLGDLCLALPSPLFMPGLVAFLCAHLCYIAAFIGRDRRLCLARLLPFALWVGGVYAWLSPGLGAMAVPVGLYCVVITIMMWRASLLAAPAAVGATLFGLSDTVLAILRFHGDIRYGAHFLILAYWAGQAGIALSARTCPPKWIDGPSATE